MTDDEHDEEIELGLVAGSGNGGLEHSTCSFCGRSATDVNCLLAGADALICDDCISRYKAELAAQSSDDG